jgi:signal transduction histidine kinase
VDAQAKAAELEASRRRLVEATDVQRRRIGDELRLGADRRLERVASQLGGARAALADGDAQAVADVEHELAEARTELTRFAHGVLPAALSERGLMPALSQLVERSAIPVDVVGGVGRLAEPVEAALFFVCSEALANVAKHAGASTATIAVRAAPERVTVEVVDDGRGGVDARRGSGLTGLADRVEALGGRLRIESPAGAGTRVVAEIPVGTADGRG